MKYLMTAIITIYLFSSCSEDIIINGYKIKEVNIEVDNFDVNVGVEGNRKIDVDQDGEEDINLGFGYFRSDTMLQSYYFCTEPLNKDIFIAYSEYIDTLYECKPSQGSGNSQTTTFNTISPFSCDESMFIEEVEIKTELYPTVFNTNELDFNNIKWSNNELIMARCEKRSNSFSGSISIVHDFWVNQREKYIFFELREKTIQKGYLKLDSDKSGSYRIYEIGLEDL